MQNDRRPPLERWLPRLLSTWRSAKSGDAPVDGLTTAEADRVAVGVKQLSQGLTGNRALAGVGYLGSDDLLGAYLLYYWPVSFAQTLAALRKAGIRRGSKALDLGSGPAPGAFALLEAGWTNVTAADRSAEALQKASELARLGGLNLRTEVWKAEESAFPAGGPWDLILLGHFVNELAPGQPDRIERRMAFLQALRPQLTPGGTLLMIEPASHGPNADALALRDRLVAKGWGVQGPCFYQKACPALAAGAACHDVLPWKVPHIVAQTARRAGIDKRELPYTWLSYRCGGEGVSGSAAAEESVGADSSRYRVLSEPMLNKAGRRRVLVCGEAGRFSLSAPGAYRSPLWLGLRRGDGLSIVNPEQREGGWGVGEATRLTMLPGQR